MAITLAQLREDLVDQLGLLAIDEMLPAASLNRSINAGLRRMSREMDWPWLKVVTTVPLVAGTSTYALPAGFIRVVAAAVNGQVLSVLSTEDMLTESTLTTPESGEALWFTIEGSNIRLAPTPNATGTLTVVYTKPENVLSADGDVVLAPDQYRDVIVTYAAIHQATRLKDQELLASLEVVRKQTLDAIKKDALKTTRAPRIQVRDDI